MDISIRAVLRHDLVPNIFGEKNQDADLIILQKFWSISV